MNFVWKEQRRKFIQHDRENGKQNSDKFFFFISIIDIVFDSHLSIYYLFYNEFNFFYNSPSDYQGMGLF